MADDGQCPRCGQALVVQGSFSTRGIRFGFRPEELRLFALSLQFPEVPVPGAAAACASAGSSGPSWTPRRSGRSSTIWAMRTCGDGWACSKASEPAEAGAAADRARRGALRSVGAFSQQAGPHELDRSASARSERSAMKTVVIGGSGLIGKKVVMNLR